MGFFKWVLGEKPGGVRGFGSGGFFQTLGSLLYYLFFFKCVKRIKLIYGVLEPSSVLKPCTPPRTEGTKTDFTSIALLLRF